MVRHPINVVAFRQAARFGRALLERCIVATMAATAGGELSPGARARVSLAVYDLVAIDPRHDVEAAIGRVSAPDRPQRR
jgi:hypothetical protein